MTCGVIRGTVLLGAWLSLVAAPSPAQTGEEAAVRIPLEDYFKGHATGDASFMRRAFHPDARIHGNRDGKLATMTVDEYVAGFSGKPAADEAKRRRTVTSLSIAGDTAIATLVLAYPAVTFTDHMTLIKVDGQWKIIGKVYHRAPVAQPNTAAPAAPAASAGPRDRPPAGPTLSPTLEILRPLVDKKWIGEMASPDGSRRLATFREFRLVGDGSVVRFTSGLPEMDGMSEGFFYWDREAQAVAVFIVGSRGVHQRGTVTLDKGVITISGRIVFPERAFDYRNTFEFQPDGRVIDRWFQNAFGPWRPGHVVELSVKR